VELPNIALGDGQFENFEDPAETSYPTRYMSENSEAFLKKVKNSAATHGKQSLQSLTKQGASIESIPISGDNIGSFRKTARKYNVDFALKKDSSTDPPNWICFFKSKDGKALDCAFKEFSRDVLKEKSPKPSIDKALEKAKDIARELTPPIPVIKKSKEELEL
jgi:hypothetical protein